MRLTVGPLSPNVYWRRRAVVAGGVLVLVLVTTYMCSGQSDAGQNKTAQDGKGVKTGASTTPSGPSSEMPNPIVITPSPGEPTGGAPPAGNSGGGGGRGASNVCADGEISVAPAAQPAPIRQGVAATLYLRIRNVSSRTCGRDVGAQMQELYIQQDATVVWSSDKCERRSGSSVVTFEPNHQVEYSAPWDGKATNRGCDNRPLLGSGTYKLFGRVGTKVSEPVTITIVSAGS